MKPSRVLRLLRISRTVSDIDEAIAFYRDALDFCVVSKVTHDGDAWSEMMGVPDACAQSVMMRLGDQGLELIAFDPPGATYPPDSSSAGLWFQHIAVVVSDIDAAYTKLQGYSFKPISEHGPQQLLPTSGSVSAYKFRDPDGHPVELIQFPLGTGSDIWQKKCNLFLGIDHSAIDVMDMERSIDFYIRLLGLRITSRTVNSGLEQARLDHLQDVLVDVVALQTVIDGVPHVELLGYKRPDGRSVPMDVKFNDVVADRLVLQVHDLASLMDMLEAENVAVVSSGMVTFPNGQRCVQVRDPTGHLLILMERESP